MNVFDHNHEYAEDESFPGLLLMRPEGPIFFANVAQVTHKIEPMIRETQPKVVVVDVSGVLDVGIDVENVHKSREQAKSTWHSLWLIGTPRVL